MQKREITNHGAAQVSVRTTPVKVKEAKVRRIMPGETIRRGEIPDDAFDYLASLPSFGGDLDQYRACRARRWQPPEPPAPHLEPDPEAAPDESPAAEE